MNLIYAVSTQTNNTVQEKVDSLCNLKAGLDNQDEASFPEEVLTQFLKISPDEEYETTIEITNNEKEDLSFKEVANRLENKETELKGKAITDETGNFVSRGRGSREDNGKHVVQKEVATPAEGLTGRNSALSGTRQRKVGSGCFLTKISPDGAEAQGTENR